MLKTNLFLALTIGSIACATSAEAATTLAAGDVAIVGYNSSNPDTVAMVTFNGFDAGTSLILTDYGWSSTNNTFRFGGEGYIQATAKRGFAAGEVFIIDSQGSGVVQPTSDFDFTYDLTTDGTALQYAPSAGGDGVILFQGTITEGATAAESSWSGTLLYGINADGGSVLANGWQADATNSNTSALPTGLVDGVTALGMVRPGYTTEFDNYRYVGTRSGTQAQLLAAIGDRANWEGVDATAYTFDATAFEVAAVPEPATAGLLGLGGLALLARRRRNADGGVR